MADPTSIGNTEDDRYEELEEEDDFEDASETLPEDFRTLQVNKHDKNSEKTTGQTSADLFGDTGDDGNHDEEVEDQQEEEENAEVSNVDETKAKRNERVEWTETEVLEEIAQLDLQTLAERIVELDLTKRQPEASDSQVLVSSDAETERRLADVRALKESGNQLYKACEFGTAFRKYAEAFVRCPSGADDDVAILYSNAASCLIRQAKLNGENVASESAESSATARPSASAAFEFEASPKMSKLDELALRFCDAALRHKPEYVKCIQKKAELCESNDSQLDEALRCYEQLCNIASRRDYETDESAFWKMKVVQLKQRVAERNERLKNEMLGKLKQLGNLVLKPFGLSTENFKMEQGGDGGYRVNFVSNSQRK